MLPKLRVSIWPKSLGSADSDVCELKDARLPEKHFDACTLIDVAAHLPHPRAAFTEIFRLLKPGGVVYITTPNFASFRSLLLRDRWEPVIPSGHLYLFSPQTLSALLESVGFTRLLNLTTAARFETELDAIRSKGELPLSETEIIAMYRHGTALEDSDKLSNARRSIKVRHEAYPLAGRPCGLGAAFGARRRVGG